MTTQIKVLHENLVKQLSSLDEDNVGIEGIEFPRKKLLAALKLQKNADVMTITYGMWSYSFTYSHQPVETKGQYEKNENGNGYHYKSIEYPERWEYKPYTKEPTPCIQFEMTANGVRQIMRFAHSPVTTRTGNGSTKHLNFVDYKAEAKPQAKPTGIALDTAELIRALQFALSGVATEESRPVLCCILFDCGNDVIKLVGADGFRLPVATIAAPGIAKDQILIHSSDIIRLIKSLKGTIIGRGKHKYYPDTFLSVGQDNTTIYFATEQGRMYFDRRDYTFPNYSQLIPTEGTKVEFVASELLQAVKPLVNIAHESSGIIRLEFNHYNDKDIIKVSARSEEHESANVCDAKIEAECRIALNAKYLTEVLAHMGDNLVTMKLTNPSSPMTFETGNLFEVVMPMFTNWDSVDKPAPVPEPEDIEESEPVEYNENPNEHDRQTVEV